MSVSARGAVKRGAQKVEGRRNERKGQTVAKKQESEIAKTSERQRKSKAKRQRYRRGDAGTLELYTANLEFHKMVIRCLCEIHDDRRRLELLAQKTPTA